MRKEIIYDKLLNNLNKDIQKFKPQYLVDKKSPKAKYYYKNIEDNCYLKPHSKLQENASAIYSSATMIYNLLGNHVTINQKEYNVEYEEELNAITPGKGRFETHKAHLDATLRNDNEIIFCEAKMTEWFNPPKKLKAAYLNKDCYLPITDIKEDFINFFKQLTKEQTNQEEYTSIYKRYDAIQMTIHILGIYNFIKEEKNKNITKISLINCIWGYEEIPEYQEEKIEAKDFITKANHKFGPLFKNLGIDFKIEYYSFHELKKLIDFSQDKKKLEYLKRYDISL